MGSALTIESVSVTPEYSAIVSPVQVNLSRRIALEIKKKGAHSAPFRMSRAVGLIDGLLRGRLLYCLILEEFLDGELDTTALVDIQHLDANFLTLTEVV